MMIKIAHLYPGMLNRYGDRGNIIALTKRMELRGISTQVDRITMGKSFNAEADNLYSLFCFISKIAYHTLFFALGIKIKSADIFKHFFAYFLGS